MFVTWLTWFLQIDDTYAHSEKTLPFSFPFVETLDKQHNVHNQGTV